MGRTRWLIRYELPRDPETGKRRQKAEIVYGTKKDAERRLREVLIGLDKGTYTVPTDLTVAEYMTDWLEKYEADHQNKKTISTARYLVNNHIIHELGFIKLKDLQPYHIDKLYLKLRKSKEKGGKELSTRTVRYVHSLLSSALNRAVALNLIPFNPADKVKPPRLHEKEVKPLTDEQRKRFLEAAQGSRLENLFIVALGTGARKGELLNLTWDQINFKDKTITFINMSNDDSTSDAKTECSKRTIPMFPDVEKALRAQRTQQAKEKLKAGPLYNDRNLVFANEVGNPLNPSNIRNRYWIPTLRKAGLPENTHFHALRHTFATTLIRKGIEVRQVSAWLGHKDPAFTFKRYHHYIPAKIDEREAERINAMIFQE
ncbi:tyrosine-type recombinase/integrase [Calderihabitans maritimus]|nr:site-specific integrase [Calderihabitans maritimus]